MRNLSPEAAALLRAGRTAFQPSAADRQRVLGALQVRLGGQLLDAGTAAGPSGPAIGGFRVPPWGWLIVSVPAIGIGVGLWTARDASVRHARGPAPAALVAAAPHDNDAPSPAAPDTVARSPLDRGANDSMSAGGHGGATSEPATGSRAASRATESSRAASSDRLSEEVALLAKATQELNGGRPDAALRTLAEHERRFPSGALAEERAVTRAQALCASGRVGEGKAELERLARVHPRSPYLERAGSACGTEPGSAQ